MPIACWWMIFKVDRKKDKINATRPWSDVRKESKHYSIPTEYEVRRESLKNLEEYKNTVSMICLCLFIFCVLSLLILFNSS